MRQVVQNYRTGELSLQEVPVPVVRPGWVLVKTLFSVISLGSEKAITEFSQKTLIGKAMLRPDLVKQVINRARKEGMASTFQHAMKRLDTPLPLGYSSCGEVIEVGTGSSEFTPGDLVALNGTGYASHSEYTLAPFNLAVKVPGGVAAESAAFGTIGGIALEGVRNTEATVGSVIAVFGLGLVGLLTAQILKAYGYQVIGIDTEEDKLKIASELGVDLTLKPDDDLPGIVHNWTEGYGVDATIICAATDTNKPIEQSASISRYRGRIVMVGVTGMELDRRLFYEKELSFVVSKSTGPGKGDPVFEFEGVDYPLGLVRWTQKRNIKEFLRLISDGQLDLNRLITHRITIDKAIEFYKNALEEKAGKVIGTLITYPGGKPPERTISLKRPKVKTSQNVKNIGLIGAGLFSKNMLYPILSNNKTVNLRALATASGVSANDVGRKLNVEYITTDYHQILADPEIDAVFITTRHSAHSKMIIDSLEAGKSVFVEKPLAVNEEGLNDVEAAYKESSAEVMTGFCRRYSPAGEEMIWLLEKVPGPKIVHYRVNAGYIPPDHWTQREPGGRIVGEVCHFVDFICALTNSLPAELSAASLSGSGDFSLSDNLTITMRFKDGSIGNILYSSKGNKAFSREYIEVYGSDMVFVNEDFRVVTKYSEEGKYKKKWSKRDMGFAAEINYFTKVLSGTVESTFARDVVVTKATFAVLEALGTKSWIAINAQETSQ